MKTYRSRSRLVMDLLAAIASEGPVGVTRLLVVANLTHATLQELLASFEARGWVTAERERVQREGPAEGGRAPLDKPRPEGRGGERIQWRASEKGLRVLADLRRVDAVMQDHGLGL
jgi:hypothetical protein